MSDQTPADEAWMHRLHQLGALPFQARGAAPRAHAFATDFLQRHGPPARIVLDGLRLAEDSDDRDHWVWDKVSWQYTDGRRVEYPNQLPVTSARPLQ